MLLLPPLSVRFANHCNQNIVEKYVCEEGGDNEVNVEEEYAHFWLGPVWGVLDNFKLAKHD